MFRSQRALRLRRAVRKTQRTVLYVFFDPQAAPRLAGGLQETPSHLCSYSAEVRHVQGQWLDPTPLVDPHQVANANWKLKLAKPLESLRDPKNRQARQKVMTLPVATEDNVTRVLNNSLLGGSSYPILTTAAGIGLGMVSGGASLLFTVGTTAMNVAVRSQRVLARGGDELWYVEEIGRSSASADARLECVQSYFLLDPFRKNAKQCGWLIHEERTEVVSWTS